MLSLTSRFAYVQLGKDDFDIIDRTVDCICPEQGEADIISYFQQSFELNE